MISITEKIFADENFYRRSKFLPAMFLPTMFLPTVCRYGIQVKRRAHTVLLLYWSRRKVTETIMTIYVNAPLSYAFWENNYIYQEIITIT